MPRDIFLNLQEGVRNVKLLPKQSLFYCFFSLINHFFVIIFFIVYINLNYFKEALAITIIPLSSNILLLTAVNNIDGLILLLLFMSLIFLIITVYINMVFIKQYLLLNIHEIRLILRLKGSGNLVRVPIIYTALMINVLSIVLVTNIIKIPYRILYELINKKNNMGLKLLEYNHFDISLLVLLFIITVLVVIFTCYILHWNLQKQEWI